MEAALWYVLMGTRGGANRARVLRALASFRVLQFLGLVFLTWVTWD